MHAQTYTVPALYPDDQRITVSLTFPSMTGGMVTAGSWVAYCVNFEMPNEADPIVIRGTDLNAPAGRDVTSDDTYRSLCGFLAYYGEHARPSASPFACDHTDESAGCPIAAYPEAVRDVLYAEADRFGMAADESESVAA